MKIRKVFALLMLVSVITGITACGTSGADITSDGTTTAVSPESQIIPDTVQSSTSEITESESAVSETSMSESEETEVEDTQTLKMTIENTVVDVIWEENASVEELKELAISGLTVPMSMYGGFEQVGPIGQSIARDDEQIATAPGDIVLYSGDQIVVFYGSNSWAYTRLGKINMSEDELTELLGNGDVTIALSVE